ncbi:hypothetical protein HDV02_004159 [Globomyces sp. JEL0801]|nr:hypothetical protein HDV02_004159 [Globomyces sp. JEL0801]
MEDQLTIDGSQTSRGTTFTNRAHLLLAKIKSQTSDEINRKFIQILREFKQKQITSAVVHDQVRLLLTDYPDLFNQFEQSFILPSHKNTLVEDNQFNEAMAFVQKVQKVYEHTPYVYQKFLDLLREYQRGGRSQDEVIFEGPDLITQFIKSYGAAKGLPKRADSNDTLPDTTATHLPPSTIPADETQPLLLTRHDTIADTESGSLGYVKPNYRVYLWSFVLVFICSTALFILIHTGQLGIWWKQFTKYLKDHL